MDEQTPAPPEQTPAPPEVTRFAVRLDAALTAEIDRIVDAMSRPGMPATRSDVLRVLAWEAIAARRAAA